MEIELAEYEKILKVYENCRFNCYPIINGTYNKKYEQAFNSRIGRLILTNLRIYITINTLSNSVNEIAPGANKLEIVLPQIIFTTNISSCRNTISSKDIPPELIMPWLGENYLKLLFKPNPNDLYLNYIYTWILEIYPNNKNNIFKMKDDISKIVFESKIMVKRNLQDRGEEQLPKYEP
ncbi:conserved putative ATP-binding protein [Saccharomycodes ludwigii]|uniref:conserved putative ATP-binding protein n=1 Tax=Saccharomycodes ludwigii TaxID=36035 RepID=UPI001E86312B|nr:conserved putative ATP-binding protein [Saccharomycodes ludwigii]KAH3898882.1 conserved putative ATP-binding protein [Saccharomycodes ludwigii]